MSWFQYLLQANLYLVLFYCFYALFLRNETFFRMNRVYLIAGALLSFLIPIIRFQWIESLFITEQVRRSTETFTLIFQPGTSAGIDAQKSSLIMIQILTAVYLTGALLCLLRFIWQLYKVNQAFSSDEPGQAFSFFNKVSVDPLLPASHTILHHEEAHADQWHSADILFFELAACINWFNPIIYTYKRAVRNIHEFIADEIASDQETSKADYAMLLLSNTFGLESTEFGNGFFRQTLLKRRIYMLSKTKSKSIATLKYGLSVPLFVIMLVFSAARIERSEADNNPDKQTLKAFPVVLEDGFYQHIQMINYPSSAKKSHTQGKVAARFKINSKGSVKDIVIIESLGYGIDEAVVKNLISYKALAKGVQGEYLISISFFI
jgi:beta-lactamase regulating signal transducer with metallopeptidase domain